MDVLLIAGVFGYMVVLPLLICIWMHVRWPMTDSLYHYYERNRWGWPVLKEWPSSLSATETAGK